MTPRNAYSIVAPKLRARSRALIVQNRWSSLYNPARLSAGGIDRKFLPAARRLF
jgi:hypothetical protein